MENNELYSEKIIFMGLGLCAPWKKFGQKMKNFEIFFDFIDHHACLYLLTKFRQNRSKIGHVNCSFLKGPPVDFFKTHNFDLPHLWVN